MAGKTRVWLVAGFAVTLAALALSGAGVVDRGLIPGDVLQRSAIARANMQQIATALMIYANENPDQLPPDLTMLYPDYICDPAVFWHPGDSDPPPTTIDNNEPNQPNSTRISFAYTPQPWLTYLCMEDPLIWDNSPANNGGLFISKLTVGTLFETDPPFVLPTPTRVQVARHNLWMMYRALHIYANNNADWFPNDPIRLIEDGDVCSPSTFWNPGDNDPEPTQITNSVSDAPDSTQISYDFLTTGRNVNALGEDEILVQDNSPTNNGGHGVNVLRANGQVAFIAICNDPFADADGDGDVDQSDFGMFQNCSGPVESLLAQGCACFDRPEPPDFPTGDGEVDLDDFGVFQRCISGPNMPADPNCEQ